MGLFSFRYRDTILVRILFAFCSSPEMITKILFGLFGLFLLDAVTVDHERVVQHLDLQPEGRLQKNVGSIVGLIEEKHAEGVDSHFEGRVGGLLQASVGKVQHSTNATLTSVDFYFRCCAGYDWKTLTCPCDDFAFLQYSSPVTVTCCSDCLTITCSDCLSAHTAYC